MSTDSTTPPQQEPPGYPPLSALRRSRSDRKLAGVAGGLGRWAGIDPLIFRILFVVLVVFGGSGLLFYALGWLLVPDDGETESEGQRLFHGSSRSVISVLALVVVLVLGLALTGSLIDSGPGHGGLGVLIVVGVVIVLLVRNGQRPTWSPPPAADGTTPAEPGSYGQTPGTAYAVSPASSSTAPTAPLPPPTGGPSYPPPGGPSYPAYAGYAPPPPPAPPRERSILGRLTFSAMLIVVGLLVGWNAATEHDVPGQVIFASALGVVGIGLVVGAFAGRSRGLIVLGLLLTLLASAAAYSPPVRGGIGDRTWHPHNVSQVRDEYRLAAGQSELDLSDVDFTSAGRTRVQLRQGVGDVLVVLPPDVVTLVDADVRVGELRLPDLPTVNGSDLTDRITVPEGSSPAAAVLVIDAHLGAGSLEVRRATS